MVSGRSFDSLFYEGTVYLILPSIVLVSSVAPRARPYISTIPRISVMKESIPLWKKL